MSRNLVTGRHRDDRAGHGVGVPIEPLVALTAGRNGTGHDLEGLGLLPDSHHVAGADAVGRNVHQLAVDRDVTVAHQLAGTATGRAEVEAERDVVEAQLAELEEHLTRDAGLGLGALEDYKS